MRLLLVRPVRTQRKEVPRTGQGRNEGPMLPGHGHLRTRAALRRKNTRLNKKKIKKSVVLFLFFKVKIISFPNTANMKNLCVKII